MTLQDINIISQYVQNMQLRIVENKLENKYLKYLKQMLKLKTADFSYHCKRKRQMQVSF
jgi:hypothetical protein